MTGLLSLEKYQLNGSSRLLLEEREKHIRIVLLPPCTVASYQYFGENPEEKVGSVLDRFVRREALYVRKPDARLFGFNPPGDSKADGGYGYENWVTVPEDMEVEAPMVRKRFSGGLYAAYTIQFPDFHEWEFLKSWAKNNERYRVRCFDDGEGAPAICLEEHLNWVYSAHAGWPRNGIDGKIDLLLPVALK